MKAVTSFDRDVDDKWHGELKRPALQRWGVGRRSSTVPCGTECVEISTLREVLAVNNSTLFH
jgi:hypothetical protein